MIKDGRFGPYVTDGETNASLRKGDDVESVTLQRAVELLAERRAAGPAKPRGRAAPGPGRGPAGPRRAPAPPAAPAPHAPAAPSPKPSPAAVPAPPVDIR